MIAIALVIQLGCNTTFEKNDQKFKPLVYEINNIALTPNEQSISDLIRNPNDQDDEKISNQLLDLTNALLPLIKSREFNSKVI